MAGGSLGDRLEERRDAMFVGRDEELAAVARLLDPTGHLRFTYITGPGGIGKSELMGAAARSAARSGQTSARVDGRDRPWTADELGARLMDAAAEGATLILLDTFEAIATLEPALRTEILPRLPDHTRVLAGGRVRLSTAWREDPGWWSLAQEIELGPLSILESRELLVRRGVDAERARRLAAELPAHPLALALFADILRTDPNASARIDDQRWLAQTLAERLLAGLPEEGRAILEAASLVTYATPTILERMLELHDGRHAFDVLRRWTFASPHRKGLRIHDLVRHAVSVDLSVRDPRRRAALLHRAARHHLETWAPASGQPVDSSIVADGYRLLSHTWPAFYGDRDDLYTVPARPAVWPELEAMVIRHEGPESLAALRLWRDEGAEIFVVRSDEREAMGFMSVVQLEAVSQAHAERDPGTLPLWRAWRDAGFFERGRVYYVRHWMAAEGYQNPSPVQASVFLKICEYLSRPDTFAMAQSFADVEFYGHFANEYSPEILPEAAFTLDGKTAGLLGRSYETSSAAALRGFLVIAADGWAAAAAAPPVEAARSPHRFERIDFEAALRQALRLCDRIDLLATSTLWKSGWARSMMSGGGPEALRDFLREESRRLFVSPRDAMLGQVIERTYFTPGQKQRAIADDLGISYGTYRRYLATATRRLVAALWSREPS